MTKFKKRYFIGLIVIIFAFVFLSGCGGGSSNNSLYTIQGTIEDTNGDIIESAKVEVGSKSTESNSEGAWQIKDLKAGKHTIKATKDGYVDYSKDVSIDSDEVFNIEMQELILANQAPEIDPIGDKTVVVENELAFKVTASDPNGDTVTLSASNLPNGVFFNSGTGDFSWTPRRDQDGNYEVTFRASDGSLSSEEIVSIEVKLSAYLVVDKATEALVKSDFKTFRRYAHQDFQYIEPGKDLSLEEFITYIESIDFSITSIEVDEDGTVMPGNKNQIQFEGVMKGTRKKMKYIDDIAILAERVDGSWTIRAIAVI